MGPVFISYSRHDSYFVNLLEEVLYFHGVEAWRDVSEVRPGVESNAKIEEVIKDCSIMIIIISGHAANSKWMTKEIALFSTRHPTGLAIPVLLENVDPESVYPGLSRLQHIDFSACMLTGFRSLLECFKKSFLNRPERRDESDRRKVKDRRRAGDLALRQRLRMGFWSAYERATGIPGKFDNMSVVVQVRHNIIEHLEGEARKYLYLDKDTNEEVTTEGALDRASLHLWSDLRRRRKDECAAIHLIEGIAEELFKIYRIKPVEKQRAEDRRTTTPN